MEVNIKRAEAAKACLDFNANLDTVHVTSDLECFPNRNDAVNHARSLEDTSVDVFHREGDGDDFDVDFDLDESEDLTDELNQIPEFLTANALASGNDPNAQFELNNPPVNNAPVTGTTPVINQGSIMDGLNAGPVGGAEGSQITEGSEITETGDGSNGSEITQGADAADNVIDNRTPAQKRADTIAKNKAAALNATKGAE